MSVIRRQEMTIDSAVGILILLRFRGSESRIPGKIDSARAEASGIDSSSDSDSSEGRYAPIPIATPAPGSGLGSGSAEAATDFSLEHSGSSRPDSVAG